MSELLKYRKSPQIYVYSVPGLSVPGVKYKALKVGYTDRDRTKDFDAVAERVYEQNNLPVKPLIEHFESAITKEGRFFRDHLVHKALKDRNVRRIKDGNGQEWYDTDLNTIKSILNQIKLDKRASSVDRVSTFGMRPEQEKAVEETSNYFKKYPKSSTNPAPHFLWNAKMRFGKTFTTYQLAKEMGWKRILVLTYKPATEKAWREDLDEHVDFDGWQFIGGKQAWENIDETMPVVWFASYQDVMGTKQDGDIKDRHKKMREENWDCLVVDEYHYGAWRDAAKELTTEDNAVKNPLDEIEEGDLEQVLPLSIGSYLYLSGTPFRALAGGEFSEDQIFNWTYADEQRAKKSWTGEGQNPYAELPQIVMMTYQMPDSLRKIAKAGEFNEFDLNTFFKAKKNSEGRYVFERENDVQKFLNLLRGMDLEIAVENKMEHKRPALPFEDSRLLSTLTHTFWFLPNVDSCRAMETLLQRDPFFGRDYKIIRAAGSDTPGGDEAVLPVIEAVGDGIETRTITLSCSKLSTGVTVRPWSGVLFLRNTEVPETYFQAAFRAQNPWSIPNVENPNERDIIKPVCYVLDFAPSRALKLMANYSNELGGVKDSRSAEKRLEEFIEVFPVLCYDGISMTKLDATAILDISTYGTASTMLAKRWQAARLVDVTTVVLEKVLNSPDIMAALEKIEDFRTLRGDLTKVINSEKDLNKAKKERAATGEEPDEKVKKKEAGEEKENKGFKKVLREKLLKFVSRIPVFMYLTDYREERLIDVIRNFEPELFTKVTGLTIRDFDRMCEIGVFNQNELNQAIFV